MKHKEEKICKVCKNLFHGEKNGREIGKMFCTAVSVAREANLRHCNCNFSY